MNKKKQMPKPFKNYRGYDFYRVKGGINIYAGKKLMQFLDGDIEQAKVFVDELID